MNRSIHRVLLALGAAASLDASSPAFAFPPAPDHVFYGTVRDQYGDPIVNTNTVLTLTTAAGKRLTARINPRAEPGANYKLNVPMDAGLTSDAYKPNALLTTVPFRIDVKIGAASYVPIEMKGDYARLGLPGKRTHLDLTLGQDSVGDGIPDAWRLALIAQSGRDLKLADIKPDDDFDGDGLSNRDEYIAGTYAWDPSDTFELKIVSRQGPLTELSFTAITGRTYSVLGSSDLKTWVPVSFRVTGPDPETQERSFYGASDVRLLRLQVRSPDAGPPLLFFKGTVK